MNKRDRTPQSVKDGFGGDSYRRRKVSSNMYQCGCKWIPADEIPEAYTIGIRGDVLVECKFHKAITETLIQKSNKTQ